MGGRIVDLYPAKSLISVIVLSAETVSESALYGAVLEVMRSIRQSSSPRLRERDFSVFLCRWTVHDGKRCVGIGLPHKFDDRLRGLFVRRISSLAPIEEISESVAQDVGATPLARYVCGNLVVYVSPLDTNVTNEQYGADVELRSAELIEQPRQERRMYALPKVRENKPQRHSIDTWNKLRPEIMEFVGQTIEPAGFTLLRKVLKEQCGIDVRLDSTSAAGRHGAIATDWMTADDQSCEVTIFINRDLSDQFRFVVLAHELAHYVLHFPLLLVSQLVEQLSWTAPDLERRYQYEFHRSFGSGLDLEEQANAYASELLIPPKYPLQWLSGHMREHAGSVSADELAWRFLGGFFPERSSTDYSFRNYEEMQEHAQQEISWATDFNALSVDTLYRVMLNATIKRESPEFKRLSSRVNTAVFDLWHNLPTILDLNSASNTNMMAGSNSAMTTLDPSATSRQILAPLEGDPDTALRLPLVPARASKGSQRWLSVLDPAEPRRLVAEWQNRYPSYAITLYWRRHIAKRPVYTFESAMEHE